jgi:glycosyltransferase involved in cell wall biosynthesis
MDSLKPWASFCMTTYLRPTFLKIQIELLLKQSFANFEIVISDNDPLASGKKVADSFNDVRIKYESNNNNLGMIQSYNRTIERAEGDFIVMVTDDDPVFENMLEYFHNIQKRYPGFCLYGAVKRSNTSVGAVEIIDRNNFMAEILDRRLTPELHWSSFLIKKTSLLEIGKLSDYGSGHLIDHALLAIIGSKNGAFIVNEKFSEIQLHDTNYSKINFENYYLGCIGFYNVLTDYYKHLPNYSRNQKAILNHLRPWFITSFFNLRRFYTFNHPDKFMIKELDLYAEKIMLLPFMKTCRTKYEIKKMIFQIKNIFLKSS